WRERADARTLVLSLAPPVILGYAFERRIEETLGGPRAVAAGLLAGAIALAAADRRPAARPRPRRIAARDGVILGLAQAAALVPGVSRTGATLAAARARGFSREAASSLS